MKKIVGKILTTVLVALFCTFTAILGVSVWGGGKSVEASAEEFGSYNVGLNKNEYDLRDNGVATDKGEKYLYLAIEGGESIPYGDDWSVSYSSDKHFAANITTITAERAQEIIDENRKGVNPIALSTERKQERELPVDLATQEDLERFDVQLASKKKKKKKNKQRNGDTKNNAKGNSGNSTADNTIGE